MLIPPCRTKRRFSTGSLVTRNFAGSTSLHYQALAEDLAHEVIEIVDDARGDYVEKVRANGRVVTVFDPDNLARCRLRCDVRWWVVERLAPKGLRFSKQERTENNGRRM